MNIFSISDIENLVGVKAHTLRIWEQRYSFLKPKRKASLHRTYDNEDLKKLLQVTHLYRKGYKISHIAALSELELRRLSLEPTENAIDFPVFINQLLEASIDLEQHLFESRLNYIILRVGFEKTVTEVLFPLLHKLGLLWMVEKISPAQEHFASAIVIKKLLVAIDGLPGFSGNTSERRVLLFTPENEYHEIPMLLINYCLRKNGVHCRYIGKNCSVDVLKSFVQVYRPTEIYFHVITYLSNVKMKDYLEDLSQQFPSQQIYCSGTAELFPSPLAANVRLLEDHQAMVAFTKSR